ncbi:MAG TPA: hypothetical protein VL133_05410, partial [Devosia sp.]|nr:hypothetical protein [Devosia sp.]
PIEIVLQLQSALGNFSNSFLLNIQDREIAAGVAAEDHFWNHFDIKTGQSSEKILATHMNAQPWITQKLAIVGIGEENWVLPGYGENVISQVRGNGALVSEFRKMMALPLWNEKFAGFFSFLVWFFISSPRRVT